MRRKSSISFVDARSATPADALSATTIEVTSEGLPWSGVHVECGRNDGWEVHDLAVQDHYLALNTDPVPLRFEVLRPGKTEEVVMPPGAIWFCPAGESFSHRVRSAASFALLTITPKKLDQLVGGEPLRLQRRYAVVQPQLEHLTRALVAEAEHGGPGGPMFVDAIAAAVGYQVKESFGARPISKSELKGGLPPARLRRVLERLEAGIAEGVHVDEMAREADLSPAHFARAFKHATGTSPHQYLMGMRLDRARAALVQGVAISEAALTFGFADQAHFSRAFAKKYGVTPGALVKASREAR